MEEPTSTLRESVSAQSSGNDPEEQDTSRKRVKCEYHPKCRQQVINSCSGGGLKFKE